MIRLETLIELRCLNSSCSSLILERERGGARGKRLHTRNQHLRNHCGLSVACSTIISLFSCSLQRIVTCPLDSYWNVPTDFQWHFLMDVHFARITSPWPKELELTLPESAGEGEVEPAHLAVSQSVPLQPCCCSFSLHHLLSSSLAGLSQPFSSRCPSPFCTPRP